MFTFSNYYIICYFKYFYKKHFCFEKYIGSRNEIKWLHSFKGKLKWMIFLIRVRIEGLKSLSGISYRTYWFIVEGGRFPSQGVWTLSHKNYFLTPTLTHTHKAKILKCIFSKSNFKFEKWRKWCRIWKNLQKTAKIKIKFQKMKDTFLDSISPGWKVTNRHWYNLFSSDEDLIFKVTSLKQQQN